MRGQDRELRPQLRQTRGRRLGTCLRERERSKALLPLWAGVTKSMTWTNLRPVTYRSEQKGQPLRNGVRSPRPRSIVEMSWLLL